LPILGRCRSMNQCARKAEQYQSKKARHHVLPPCI
jgi:hypothetical protein